MDWIKGKVKDIIDVVHSSISDDKIRKEFMFECLNILLAMVSLFMTVVNVFTKEYTLMLSTFIFFIACIGNIILIKCSKKITGINYMIFVVETIALFSFFLISGIPNGFSALWVCLVPSFSLLIFGLRYGTFYSALIFFMLLFFFWLPFGRELLWYSYTDEFMLRFPFLFVACYMIALLVEGIRAQTQKQLVESEQKYYHLYRYDALTGLYNRYGFNAVLEKDLKNSNSEKVAIMILDIDNFKRINDQYGHNNGDVVLKGIAGIIKKSLCCHTHYCRWGGEEFTIYMHCKHDYKEAAERLRRSVEKAEFSSDDLVMNVTISIGLCISKAVTYSNIEMMINEADKCLYEAKGSGKNCVVSVEI